MTKIPRVKEKNVRIREIQKAAKEIFFNKGFANTNMEEIAKKADVSKGTIYLHFKNKDELYVSLMMPVLRELGNTLSMLEKKLDKNKYFDKKDFILDLYHAHLRVYEFDPDGIKIIQAFQQYLLLAMSDEMLVIVNKLANRNFNILRRLLTKAMKAGIIKAINILKLADIVWALFIGVVQIEESKLMVTGKDHLKDTLLYSYMILGDGL